jgi:hypothetical protein
MEYTTVDIDTNITSSLNKLYKKGTLPHHVMLVVNTR